MQHTMLVCICHTPAIGPYLRKVYFRTTTFTALSYTTHCQNINSLLKWRILT